VKNPTRSVGKELYSALLRAERQAEARNPKKSSMVAAGCRFLVKLLGAKLDRLARAMVLRLLQGGLEEHLSQQFGMIEILGIAVEERERRQFGLLRVQILCLLKLEQRADVIGLRRVNDDDALTLLELSDQVVAVERSKHAYGNSDKEPKPGQPVALGKQLGRIEPLPRKTSWRGAVAGGSLARSESFHESQ
jgi:hypothetical protein